MTARHLQCIGHLVDRHIESLGQFLGRRTALVLLLELRQSLRDFVQRTYLIKRQTHNTALLGQCLQNRLTNPPYGVGYKLESACFIKLLGGLNQAEITLVDKVWETESLILILFGYGNDKTEVGACKLLKSPLISFTDALCKLYLLLNRDKLLSANLLKILVERRAFAVGD